MKKNYIVYSVLFLAVAVVFNGCTGLKKMKKTQGVIKYTLSPNPLEMHGDSVVINVTGKYPAKYYKKKVTCEITPVLKSANGTEIPLKVQKVQGEKVQDNNTVIKFLDGGGFNYNTKVAYTPEMRICDVNIKVHAFVKKKFVDFDPFTIGKGTIATPGLLEKDAKAILAKDNLVRVFPEEKAASILYVINQANVRPQELTKDEMKQLKKYLEATQTNTRKQIKGVNISSYASPDGPEELNTKLSGNRGGSADKVIKDQFKKFDKAKEQGFFNEKTTPEDWEGFQKLMQESDLADKDLVLRVLSMYSDPVQREKEIKNIGKVFTQIADKVLPKLRRSQFKVNVDSLGRNDDEINRTFDSLPQALNVEELLHGATLTQDLNRQLKFYQAASNQYGTDWRGFNNAGFVYILQGNLSDAKTQFEKAKTLNAGNNIVLNNLGAIALREGDFVKAEEYFKSASGAGTEVNYNLGICDVKKGDYNGAVALFGSYCSFNAALAKLLSGNPDAASKTIDCAQDKDRDMMFYLKAIIGARQANTDLMYNSLRAAISKTAALNEQAKTDMEFFKYFNDDTFKSIIK
jgi:tetratricopeptide (TPR) repeat protein/outer membrane protein OmpA-like peptidoglycan-associated protein